MNIINESLKEDIGKGDVTTNSIIPEKSKASAKIIAKEEGIIAGLDLAKEIFKKLDPKIKFLKKVKDGDYVKKGKVVCEIYGKTKAILSGERVALNFLQRMSGIATLTNKFVKLSPNVKIMDTRKTTPILRKLERYAVKIGGGVNHRFNLNSMVLIKENHIEIAGGIKQAIKLAKKSNKKIEIEVKNLKELREAIKEKPDRIMLDNMSLKEIKEAIKINKGKIELEVSGGVNLKTIKEISKTKVDCVSVGALTHSAKALDLSLILKVK